MIALSFIVYLASLYFGYKLMKTDSNKILNQKDKILISIWFTIFIVSQVIWIGGVMNAIMS